ncbi:helicase-associated domain-containing protein [Streptomyces sp. URMC 129]|uniref:helicase-associated domain-containing protein n=1 Tax=Streptomyces sp. URMC 129 TaxID=3423407 RepID=UPI003F1B02A5
MTSTSPRTLADELRSRSDAELAGLLRARADLLSPLPGDVSQLATRAGTRASVLRALDRLDTFTLQTAEALAIAPQPCPYPTLAALLPGADEQLPDALATLRARALLWGRPEAPRLVRTAQELLAPTASRPSGTGLGPTLAEAAAGIAPSRMQHLLTNAGLPPTHDPVSALTALTALFTDRDRLAALLDEAGDAARAILERLAWGPPYGEVSARPGPPVRRLLDLGLLMPTAPGTVVLPREVALHLRGGRAHRELRPHPPWPTLRARLPQPAVDAAAGGAAYAALTMVEELLTAWETDAPAVLRTGGLAARDLKRVAVTLDMPEPEAAFWVELAYAAGLLAADGEVDERFAPTPAYDAWLELPPARRWARLATAWLATTRVPGLVGTRDGKGRLLAALGPGLDRGPAVEVRRHVLALLTALPEGGAPQPGDVQERVRWELPRRVTDETRTLLCGAVVAEAEYLGVTGRGALASFVRPLLDPPATGARAAEAEAPESEAPEAEAPEARAPDEAGAADLLAPLLPEAVDHILVQADLTAIAPGPLRRELRQAMAMAADVESTGGATVYRFTPGSVRRALDGGWTAEDLHAFLAAHSRTPVPQPLTYLVDDVARRHGRLRVGVAASYVRCDDEALLTQLLADRRAEPLRLRRLAPTVAVSASRPDTLLERLREIGFAPAAESAEGAVLTPRQRARRTPPRTAPEPVPDSPPPADDALLTAAVRAIRAGDHAADTTPRPAGTRVPEPTGPPPRTSPDETLARLRAAARDGTLVWIGYVGADGVATHRVLSPVRVEGGFVTAFDHTADEVRTYPLHRITGSATL